MGKEEDARNAEKDLSGYPILEKNLKRVYLDEETHTYYVDGNAWPLSVSGLWGQYFSHFDSEGMVKKKLSQWEANSSSKYFELIRYARKEGIDPGEAILQTWEANGENASSMGTYMHKQIENYVNGEDFDSSSKEVGQFLRWREEWNPLGEEGFSMTPWLAEVSIFCEEAYVAGQIDSLWKDNSGRVWMVDWKRCNPLPYSSSGKDNSLFVKRGEEKTSPLLPRLNVPSSRFYQLILYLSLVHKKEEEFIEGYLSSIEDLFEFEEGEGSVEDVVDEYTGGKKKKLNVLSPNMENIGKNFGHFPCDSVPDTPFGHYCIQQNVYRLILERNYGIPLSGMYLAQFHPFMDDYHSVQVPDLRHIASQILEIRACELFFLMSEEEGKKMEEEVKQTLGSCLKEI